MSIKVNSDFSDTKSSLSDRINKLSESQTIQMAKISRELKSRGVDVIDLSLGEPDFDTPLHIRNGAKKAIDDGFTHYTPVSGFLDLREAISKKFKRDNNLNYVPDQIVVSTGAKQALANVMLCLINQGDEVILPSPFWVSYSDLVKLAEGKAVIIPTGIESNFKITPEQLEKAITEKTKLVVFSSPCNPTGTVYSREELKAFAEVIARHPKVFIMADEIYEFINYKSKHESIAQFDFIYDRVITVNGLSKGFAMTGWRVGYIGAPKWLAQACDKMQGQFTSGTCSIAQKAAVTALNSDLSPTQEMSIAFKKRRDIILKMLKEIPGIEFNVPEGAFYVFPKINSYFGKTDGKNTIHNADDFCMYLLHAANVATVTGNAFGVSDYFRISYSVKEEKLILAIERIKEALKKLY